MTKSKFKKLKLYKVSYTIDVCVIANSKHSAEIIANQNLEKEVHCFNVADPDVKRIKSNKDIPSLCKSSTYTPYVGDGSTNEELTIHKALEKYG